MARRETAIFAALVVLTTILGIVARARYALVLHHPRHFITSDSRGLVALAERLVDAPAGQGIGDTIWPPGGAALLAPLLAVDPSLELAAVVQVVFGTATFLLVGHTAHLVLGRRAGLLALLFAALHFGFIHYGGFFLSEQPFQFAIALSLWAAVAALQCDAAPREASQKRPFSLLRALSSGAAVGACFALAAAIRPNAIPVALITAGALSIHALHCRAWSRLCLVAGGGGAAALLLAPLAWRCTRLSSGFCPVSNNFLMNVALGQAGEVSGLNFRSARHPELATEWVPPALLNHGYHGVEHVPFSIYDAPGVLRWVLERWRGEPGRCLLRALGNVLDLFRIEWWPGDFGGVPERVTTVAAQVILLFVVLPGVVAWVRMVRASGRAGWSSVPLLFTGLVTGMLAVAAFSLGESRYRIPFDGVFIVLASAFYTSTPERLAGTPTASKLTTTALAVAGAIAVLLVLTIARVSAPTSPPLSLRSSLAFENRTTAARRPITEFSRMKLAGSAWDAPGNYVFRCGASCEPLELEFGAPTPATRIELSVDDNDRYEVAFLRGELELARADLLPRDRGGMRVEAVDVPAAARAGFNRLRVTPLYGDGKYSLGHARLLVR